jgi:hypothetical protein
MAIAAVPVGGKWSGDGPALSGLGPEEPEQPEQPEAAYGWCGLCHLFTEFPHDCRGTDSLAEPELSPLT